MTAKIFIDTNILVYAYDLSESEKQPQAVVVLERLVENGLGVVSTQVLAEFFTVATRKIAIPLSVDEAYAQVKEWLQALTVIDLTGLIVLEAVRGVRDHQLNFWDAQIWAAARLNQVPVIFSENFRTNAVVEGVRVVNPFAASFQLEDWA